MRRHVTAVYFVPVLLAVAATLPAQTPPSGGVDLSGAEYGSLGEIGGDPAADPRARDPVAQREWFRRFDLWGYVAAGYLQTESGGSRPGGALLVDQASLFVRALVREDLSAFLEIQTDRSFTQQGNEIRIGEAYAHLAHALDLGEDADVGIKAGRVDIPFGEYYLREDANENPLISYPAGAPYGVDEGVLVYGKYRRVGLIAAYQDGNADRQSRQGLAHAFTVRVHGDPFDGVYLSSSYLHSGETAASAIYFSGPPLFPVGVGAPSTLGATPSSGIALDLLEADLRLEPWSGTWLWLAAGHGFVHDDAPGFDRSFSWFLVEPSVALSPALRATFRWSEIGTYDSSEGFRFEGKQFANASETYGYDLQRLTRLAAGLAWNAIDDVLQVKAEVGFDRLQAIRVSPVDTDWRAYTGLEVVLEF